MAQPVESQRGGRSRLIGITIAAALLVAACGSTAPAASTAPNTAPSVAVTSSQADSASPTDAATASAAAGASAVAAVDAAVGLKIDAPYTLTELPAALKTTFETQMASGLGAFGGSIKAGFRQVGGATGIGILMVIGFPSGTLNEAAYQAALTGMGSSMQATTFTTTTVNGVTVSTGGVSTGGVAVFHVGDHMLVLILQSKDEGVPIATALITANQ